MNDDTLMRDISVCVKDIKGTQELIVGQINQIDVRLHEGKACFSSNDKNDALRNSIMQRILTLENKEKETKQEVSRLERRLEELHESLKNIEIHRGLRLDKRTHFM